MQASKTVKNRTKAVKSLGFPDIFRIFAVCLITIKFQIGGHSVPRVTAKWRRLVFVIRFVRMFLQNTRVGCVFFLTLSRRVNASII